MSGAPVRPRREASPETNISPSFQDYLRSKGERGFPLDNFPLINLSAGLKKAADRTKSLVRAGGSS